MFLIGKEFSKIAKKYNLKIIEDSVDTPVTKCLVNLWVIILIYPPTACMPPTLLQVLDLEE